MTVDDDARAGDALAAGERIADLGRRYMTRGEVASRAGIDQSVADRLWRALGFPNTGDDERAFTDQDLRALRIATEGLERLEGDERERAVDLILREARVLSAHLADVAEVEIDAMVALRQLGVHARTLDEAVEQGLEGSNLDWLIGYALRRQLDGALRRRSSTESRSRTPMVIAFIDLVDYTATTSRLGVDALGPLLAKFETLVFDTVAEAHGRVVKLIGDEAMMVWQAPDKAAAAVLDIVDRCGSGPLPLARAGLAAGPVLARAGDYFGPPVNTASRIVAKAEPGQIVVDAALAEQLRDSPDTDMTPLGCHDLKGLGEVELWRLTSAR